MSISQQSARRRPLIVGCIGVALLLVAALGYEAVTAGRAQREVAEGVLRDYAGLAAGQYSRSAAIALEYEWFLPVLALVGKAPAASFPDPETEVEGQLDKYPVGELASRFFWLDLQRGEFAAVGADGIIEASSSPFSRGSLAEIIRIDATTRYEKAWYSAAIFEEHEGQPRILVYRVIARTEEGAGLVHGFVGTVAAAERLLGAALALYDLLPESLTEGIEGDDLVSISVTDDGGRSWLQSGVAYRLAAEATTDLGPRFTGLQVAATISPESAALLIVGGLPRSRLPLIGGMFAITVVLLVAGVALLRREQELVDLREQFVAGASHELRTPLAQIRMFTETLRLRRIRSSEERERYLATLDREARRLTFLVDNLLQFSRAGQTPLPFTPESANIGELTAEIVEDLQPLAAARGAHIDVAVEQGAHAEVDRDMLRQVLLNLLDNAIKYGPEGQRITVSVAPINGDVVLSVTDQGSGVPAAEQAHVWERFWRGRAAEQVGGTGIGLSLVKELVEVHGGKATVENAPGGGARFVVRLSAAASP